MNGTYCVELLGIVPCFDETVADRETGSLVCAKVIEVESGAGEGVLHVVYD